MAAKKKEASQKKPENKNESTGDSTIVTAPRHYFASENKDLSFISSGCTLLDCVLGGGWPLGRISNIAAPESAGKCVRNAWINSPQYGMCKIDDIGESMNEGASPFLKDLAHDSKSLSKTNAFWKEQVSTTYAVKTAHGYEIEGTADHKLLVWTKDCDYVMRQMKDLRSDDVLVIQAGTNVFPKNKVSLVAHKEATNAYFTENSKHITNLKEISFPEELDEDLAKFLGYFIADGNFLNSGVQISNSREWVLADIKRILVNYDLTSRPCNSGIQICSAKFKDFLKRICGLGSKPFTARNKEVPNVILQSPRSVQISFLRSLIDCDGYASKKEQNYYTASELLSEQVKMMLLNLGIVVTHKTKNNAKIGNKTYDWTYHQLSVYSKYLSRYRKIIGSDKYKNWPPLNEKATNSYTSIPYLSFKLEGDRAVLRDRIGWAKNGTTIVAVKSPCFPDFEVGLKSEFGFMPEFRLKRIIENSQEAREWFPELSFYEEIVENDYFYDFIDSHEKLEHSNPVYVYDVCVPSKHLFWANGFINHNTQVAMETVANFLLKYPQGQSRYIDAEFAIDEGFAESMGIELHKAQMPNSSENEDDWVVTVEDFNSDLLKFLDEQGNDSSGLYVVDSLDSLSTKAELARKIDEGSYKTEKSKLLPEIFRKIKPRIKRSNIHLMFVSQVRENMNAGIFAEHYKVSGGKSFDHWCDQRLWLTHMKYIHKTVNGVKRPVGIQVKAKVKKNRIGLPFRECQFNLYFNYGIDNLEASLNWLIESNFHEEVGFKTKKEAQDLYKAHVNRTQSALRGDDLFDLEVKCAEVVKKMWPEIETSFLPENRKY